MVIQTGQTVYELIRSFNPQTNDPVVPASFNAKMYFNGSLDTGTTINISISDSTEGIYSSTWSATTQGYYQLHIENTTTDVVFVSNVYDARDDISAGSATVYVGL